MPDQDRFSRNAHDHSHAHDHDHAHQHDPEGLLDRATRFGLRVVDGKDREGADDLGNDLDFLAAHDHQVEQLRQLLKSGLSLGELFATSTELRTTTPRSLITMSTGKFYSAYNLKLSEFTSGQFESQSRSQVGNTEMKLLPCKKIYSLCDDGRVLQASF